MSFDFVLGHRALLAGVGAASTFVMVGIIWIVQLVHYPSFAFVDVTRYIEFQTFHERNISFIVVPLMVVEALCAFALLGSGGSSGRYRIRGPEDGLALRDWFWPRGVLVGLDGIGERSLPRTARRRIRPGRLARPGPLELGPHGRLDLARPPQCVGASDFYPLMISRFDVLLMFLLSRRANVVINANPKGQYRTFHSNSLFVLLAPRGHR